jgi:hypothetical protein
MESAEATVVSDIEHILTMIRESIGYAAVDRTIRGSIVGALTNHQCVSIVQAALGYPQSFEDLLRISGADKHGDQKEVCEAITAAAGGGFSEQLGSLIDQFPHQCECVDEYGRRPLMHAARGGHHLCIRILMEAGADPNAVDKTGWNMFCHGAPFMTAESLTYVASKGGDPFGGPTNPLMLAAQDGHFEICEALVNIAPTAVINASGDIGYTPLRQAVAFNHLPLAQYFVQLGANINAKDNHGQSILYWAINEGNPVRDRVGMVKFILDSGCEIDEKAENMAKKQKENGRDGADEVLLLVEGHKGEGGHINSEPV